jgi:pilus assembly protein CpaD
MAQNTFLAGALVAGLLAGMASPAEAHWRDRLNPSVNSVNQPVVQRTDYVMDLMTAGNGVPDRELGRLADWFDSLRLGYGDRIAVDSGPYEDPRARSDVASVAGRYGLLLTRGVPITAGAVQPGSVRVIVSRSTASVPGCPDWSEAPEIGNRITTGSNYGCALNSNLAAMIADPNDLVLGQAGAATGDADTASKAIKVYREAVPTGTKGLKETVTKGGK